MPLPPPLEEPPPPEDMPPPDVPQPVMALMMVRLSRSMRNDAIFGLRRKPTSRPRSPPARAMPDAGRCMAALDPVVLMMTVVLTVLPPVTGIEAGAVEQVGG